MHDDGVTIRGKRRLLLRPIRTPEMDEECREMAKAAPTATVVLSTGTEFAPGSRGRAACTMAGWTWPSTLTAK